MGGKLRCVQFCPSNPKLLAAGLMDGKINIINTEKGQITKSIKQTTSRITCLQWHPSSDSFLAFGSFDCCVRVHNFNDGTTIIHANHSDRVRALYWNPEVSCMLISGADDNQIIGWNILTREVLFKTQEPSLSLTSFACHPARPFTLYSSHFDASL